MIINFSGFLNVSSQPCLPFLKFFLPLNLLMPLAIVLFISLIDSFPEFLFGCFSLLDFPLHASEFLLLIAYCLIYFVTFFFSGRGFRS